MKRDLLLQLLDSPQIIYAIVLGWNDLVYIFKLYFLIEATLSLINLCRIIILKFVIILIIHCIVHSISILYLTEIHSFAFAI